MDDRSLSEGELEILVDGLSDEVAFIYVLGHLGLDDPYSAPLGSDRMATVNTAIASLQRLVDLGLILVGHTEYIDKGPPGRLAPYEHVAEPPDDVWDRIRQHSLDPEPGALDWICWCVNTPAGDDLARRHADQRGPE